MWGNADDAFRAPDRDRFVELFPHHEIVNLGGTKNFVQENAPDEIASAILGWYRQRLRLERQ